MDFKLKNIFKGNSTPLVASTPSSSSNTDALRDGETYVKYGKRLCGYSNGNIDYLPVYFQKVIQSEKKRYIQNEGLQNKEKERIKREIIDKQTLADTEKNNLSNIQRQIDDISNKMQEKKGKINELQIGGKNANREAKVKFYFGVTIITLLTVYLAVFYSSTFYSAFFGAETVENLSDAMFNTHAIPSAISLGFGPAVFVLTAPVIFMALGYALHYFSMQKGVGKYFKVAACIFVTFIFDCLLAYSIAAKCYQSEAMNSLAEMPPYSMSMATSDINVWIVIFCGFITYMIWGIVLDMTLSAYAEFKSNAVSIAQLRNEIEAMQKPKAALAEKENNIKNNISALEGEIKALEASLRNIIIPISSIRQALSDFFSGWTSLIEALNLSEYDAQRAHEIYNSNINSLDNDKMHVS